MLKFLLIMALALYILSKVGSFIFRSGGNVQPPNRSQRRADGSIHVDTNPEKGKKGSSIRGGEYVDYEEVK
jgi:hypothetical protein